MALLPDPVPDLLARGMRLSHPGAPDARVRVQLLADASSLGTVLQAAALLERGHGVGADVWSVISYGELAREGIDAERAWRQGSRATIDSWFGQQMAATAGPIVAATLADRALPELVRAFVPFGRRFLSLAATGFGREDVDAAAVVQAALRALEELAAWQQAAEQRRIAAVMSLASI